MTDHYSFIHDENEILQFLRFAEYENYMAPYEVLFISLSARNKYLSDEEKEEYQLGRNEMFAHKLIRAPDYSSFIKTLRTFETSFGSYLTKNGKSIPPHIINVYLNINPSNMIEAVHEFVKNVNDVDNEILSSFSKKVFEEKILFYSNADRKLLTEIQKSRSKKMFLDYDFDFKEGITIDEVYPFVKEKFISPLRRFGVKILPIKTRSGMHLLLRTSSMKGFDKVNNPSVFLEEVKKNKHLFEEVIINNNAMIPLPGTNEYTYIIKE